AAWRRSESIGNERDRDGGREEERAPIDQSAEHDSEGEPRESSPRPVLLEGRVAGELKEDGEEAQRLVVHHAAEVRAHWKRGHEEPAEERRSPREHARQELHEQEDAPQVKDDDNESGDPGRIRSRDEEGAGEEERDPRWMMTVAGSFAGPGVEEDVVGACRAEAELHVAQ